MDTTGVRVPWTRGTKGRTVATLGAGMGIKCHRHPVDTPGWAWGPVGTEGSACDCALTWGRCGALWESLKDGVKNSPAILPSNWGTGPVRQFPDAGSRPQVGALRSTGSSRGPCPQPRAQGQLWLLQRGARSRRAAPAPVCR